MFVFGNLFGVIGLILGFGLGLGVIGVFLRSVATQDLKENKSIWWTYGLAVWIFAGLGCYAGVFLYGRYF